MGAWGTGPFENDDAADWSYQLVDGAGPDVVAAALRAVQGGSAPDAPADSSTAHTSSLR